ncbi:MAG: hypothetical protein L3J71_16780 [Victivallaceae bacterium]|nr:hypothetical protein [Victivallaceae bacterium]
MKKTIILGTLALTLTGMANLYSAETAEQSVFDLSKNGYKKWKAINPEASISVKKEGETPIIVFKAKTDYKTEGKGWIRIYKYFFHPKIDISPYKEYVFEYKMTNSLPEDKKNNSSFYAYFNTGSAKVTYSLTAKSDGEWHKVVIKIADIISRSQKSKEDWQYINLLQFGFAESKYPDKTDVTIEIKGVKFQ